MLRRPPSPPPRTRAACGLLPARDLFSVAVGDTPDPVQRGKLNDSEMQRGARALAAAHGIAESEPAVYQVPPEALRNRIPRLDELRRLSASR